MAIRDGWVHSRMMKREAEFCQFETLNIAVGTWNVNGKRPSTSVRDWFGRADGATPDVVVVCLQEMVDLVAGNLVVEKKSRTSCDEWCHKILHDLNDPSSFTPSASSSSSSAAAGAASASSASASTAPLHEFELVQSKFLVGIMIAVFVRSDHRSQISEVHGSTVGTGIMNVMGNKGGAAVRFRMRDTTLCFVCAHLAAHRDAVESRNSDVKNIIEKMTFSDTTEGDGDGNVSEVVDSSSGAGDAAPTAPPTPPPPRSRVVASTAAGDEVIETAEVLGSGGDAGGSSVPFAEVTAADGEVRRGELGQRVLGDVGRAGWDSVASRHSHGLSYGILDHDLVIWAGDLNYRIDPELTIDEVHMLVSVCNRARKKGSAMALKSLSRLQELDQLWIARQAETVMLSMFDEAPLNFLPTYKFIAGTAEYDRRPEKKKRAPAWCDRVLWRAARPEKVQCTEYRSVTSLIGSDHMPVIAHIAAAVRTTDFVKQGVVFDDVVSDLARWENECIPRVTIDGAVALFPNARYLERSQHTVTLRNVGRIVAEYRFVPKEGEQHYCKRWLSVEPSSGKVYPGESCEIVFSVFVDTATLRALMRGEEAGPTSSDAGASSSSHAHASKAATPDAPDAVAPAIASSMSLLTASLEDVLRLQLEGGRDHLIPVSAQLLRSCFGCTLHQLVRTRSPVRSALLPLGTAAIRHDASTLAKLASPQSVKHERQLAYVASRQVAPSRCFGSALVKPMCIPKEIWRLADALIAKHPMSGASMLRVPGIFVQRGESAALADILEALDTGAAFSSMRSGCKCGKAFAHAILLLVHSIWDPVASSLFVSASKKASPTRHAYELAIEVDTSLDLATRANADDLASARALMETYTSALETEALNLWSYVVCLLRSTLEPSLSATNKLDATTLALVAANCFARGISGEHDSNAAGIALRKHAATQAIHFMLIAPPSMLSS